MLHSVVITHCTACSSLATATSYARYDPSKGYYWEFPNDPSSKSSSTEASKPKQEEPSDIQRKRVDMILGDLIKKFPPKAFARKDGGKPVVGRY